jgi:hypothetical protein
MDDTHEYLNWVSEILLVFISDVTYDNSNSPWNNYG